MTVPYTFASASAPLPLAELDADFATPITLGSTNVILGGNYTTIDGLELTNLNASGLFTGIFKTANFSIKEDSGTLSFYYQSTKIASIDSSGNLISLGAQSAGGTP